MTATVRFLFVAGLFLPGTLVGQRPYQVGRPAPWVMEVSVPATPAPPAADVSEGYEILLVDHQEIVNDTGVDRFRHLAYRLTDEGAVQRFSQVTITFDSAYQDLTLHMARVVRDGRTIDQLKPSRIRVAQRQSQLEYQIYDGSLSVVLLLEDVRRGDIVEYSYTRSGTNPVFAGHYTNEFTLRDDVPLHRLQFRLLWPRHRSLFIRRHAISLEPEVRDSAAHREYVWSQGYTAAQMLDTELPEWYRPFPSIQLSDFGSWAEVAAWGDSLFASLDPAPPALAAVAARLRAASPSQETRVLAALRWVQEEIRYLGIEIGVNTHQPYPPATVLKRRYGDCKDKTLLLITLLRELGVASRPALVNTEYGGHVREFHPTAGIFDHAIVQAEVAGRVYWLDPSALYQRDDLVGVTPGFGAALVLGHGGDSLTPIPRPRPKEPLTEIMVRFNLGGIGKPAEMRVDTRYRGRVADGIRSQMRSTTAARMQREYEDFYAGLYPAVRSEAPPGVDDNETANEIRLTEQYTIPEFWHASRNEDRPVGTFSAREMASSIPALIGSRRSMPLGLSHPTRMRYTIEAHLKEGWGIKAEEETIESAAFRFAYGAKVKGDVLTLSYDYEALSDHVLPAAAAEHFEKLSRVRRLLTFSVTAPDSSAAAAGEEGPTGLNWPVMLAALFATGLAFAGTRRINRMPALVLPGAPTAPNDGPTGINGWLILVGLNVCLMPMTMLITLGQALPNLGASNWAQLTTPGMSAYHPLWAPLLLFELVSNIGLIVFACLQIWLFFGHKRSFPGLFVILLAARAVLEWIDATLATAVPIERSAADTAYSMQLRLTLTALIWISYMFKSRRVHNTFVN